MRRNERLILAALPVVALVAAFWFLLISPKRNEASELQTKIDAAQTSIDASEQQIAVAEQARAEFPKNYGELVSLGRAVPENDDQSSLVYDMSRLGARNDLEFRSFALAQGVGEAAPPAPTPAPAPEGGGGEPATEAPAAVSAAATEAAAAALPIGATVGSAGLPVMPYEFKYLGNFFDVAGFFEDIDGQVSSKPGQMSVKNVQGRLMTIDGFALTGDKFTGFPSVEANFAVTTYLVPAEQGLSAGASPAGPAPLTAAPSTSVADSTSPASTPTPAATTAPAP